MEKEKIIESILRDSFFTKQENNRLRKIGEKIIDGKINEDNYYDEVRKFVKNVKSDPAIKSWQRLADYMYDKVFWLPVLEDIETKIDLIKAFRSNESKADEIIELYENYKEEGASFTEIKLFLEDMKTFLESVK